MVALLGLASNLPSALPKSNGTAKATAFAPVDRGVHAFKSPSESDKRSVCPALNTLCNHSYLPHDGANITFRALAQALHAGYGISPAFANFLVLGGYVLLKRDPSQSLDLHEIGKHNGVEHNASIAHDDADGAPYAPTQVDLDLLHKFLNKAYTPDSVRASEDEDSISIEDIAYARVAREGSLTAPLDAMHAEIARGEFAMVLDIFGKGPEKTVSKEVMEIWLNENRFPTGWAPGHEETLADTVAESKKMRALVNAIRGPAKAEVHQGLWSQIEKTVEGLMVKAETVVHLRSDVIKRQVVSDEKVEVTQIEVMRLEAKV